MVAPYSFPFLIKVIRTRLPVNASASVVAETLKEEGAKLLFWFDSYLRLGLVKRDDFSGDYPVQCLIAGYENRIPTIYSVQAEVDWGRTRLKGTQLTLRHLDASNGGHTPVHGVGSTRVLQQIQNRQGDLYRKFVSRLPSEGRRLIADDDLSARQAAKVVHVLLEIESEANPDQVGPPFTVVTIPKAAASKP